MMREAAEDEGRGWSQFPEFSAIQILLLLFFSCLIYICSSSTILYVLGLPGNASELLLRNLNIILRIPCNANLLLKI